jgi:hypothetical protein
MRKLTFEQFKMAEDYTEIKADFRGKSGKIFLLLKILDPESPKTIEDPQQSALPSLSAWAGPSACA